MDNRTAAELPAPTSEGTCQEITEEITALERYIRTTAAYTDTTQIGKVPPGRVPTSEEAVDILSRLRRWIPRHAPDFVSSLPILDRFHVRESSRRSAQGAPPMSGSIETGHFTSWELRGAPFLVLCLLDNVRTWLAAQPTRRRPVIEEREPGSARYSLLLVGEMWEVKYEEEMGKFADRKGSGFRHLARLLAEPSKQFYPADFFPQPSGSLPIPHMGLDARSDDEAMKEYAREMWRITEEIKEAEAADDSQEAEMLRTEFDELKKHVTAEQKARNKGHANLVGTAPNRGMRATVFMSFHRLFNTLRKRKMPHLADHLEKHITANHGGCKYTPPPGTPPWDVTHPSQIVQRIRK
jgi:hypothetical protein